MRKFLCAALVTVLMAAAALPALAGARMPEYRGVVTDDANVLGAQTVRDIEKYAERAEDDTDVRIHVAIVHFLDGLDAAAYARQLFSQWKLGDDDLLIFGAAGEDSVATVLGGDVQEKLGTKNAENLMYTSSRFSELFKAQQYDEAFAQWFTALNALLNKQYDESISLKGLFAAAQTVEAKPQTAENAALSLWERTLDSIDDNTANYQQHQESRRQQDNGIGVGGWIVLAIIIAIIFGQSDPVRRARRSGRSHYRDYGCGCSPLGWIFTMIGANAIIDALRGRRRR